MWFVGLWYNAVIYEKKGVIMAVKKESSFEIMRKKNIQAVYRTLVEHHPISRVEIAQKTGLNKMTVTNCVRSMMEAHLVVECESAEVVVGRPPILLNLNPNYGLLLGIEMNIISCKVQVMEFDGTILEQRVVSEVAEDPEHFLEFISLLEQEYREKQRESLHGLLGIGIALPGNYNYDSGCVEYISNMQVWNGFPIRQRLEEILPGVPLLIQNAARAEATGELAFGGMPNSTDVIYINGAMGLALSMYSRGGMHVGYRGFNGRFGHNIIMVGGRECACGNRGCLEMYASTRSICNRLYPGKKIDDRMLREIVERRKLRDPEVQDALMECVKYLAVGLGNIINSFNPGKVCIGNYLGVLLDSYEEDLNREVSQYLLPHYREDRKIILSPLDIWGASLGSAAHVRNYYFEHWLTTEVTENKTTARN